jgi:hypothetical protein
MYEFNVRFTARRQRRLTELEKDTDTFLYRHEAEFADLDQRREEREQRWELEKMERETQLTNTVWRERILMAMSVVLFLCALGLLIVGAVSGDAYVLGGSGASGTAGIVGMLRLALDREKASGAHRAG